MTKQHYDVNNKPYDVIMKAFYEHSSMEAKLVKNAVNQHFGSDKPSLSPLEKTTLQENGCVDTESSFWGYARKDRE